MTRYALKASEVRELVVTLPDNEASTVDSTTMPATCVQHLLGLMLIDGTVTFASCHDDERMRDPAILGLRRRMRLIASAQLSKARPRRQAVVEVMTVSGRRLKRRTAAVRGTADNPMDRPEVEAKALDLVAPVLGTRRAHAVLKLIWKIESVTDMRKLRLAYRA
jgi:2-methylcitrate dehydratase PrpD